MIGHRKCCNPGQPEQCSRRVEGRLLKSCCVIRLPTAILGRLLETGLSIYNIFRESWIEIEGGTLRKTLFVSHLWFAMSSVVLVLEVSFQLEMGDLG